MNTILLLSLFSVVCLTYYIIYLVFKHLDDYAYKQAATKVSKTMKSVFVLLDMGLNPYPVLGVYSTLEKAKVALADIGNYAPDYVEIYEEFIDELCIEPKLCKR